MLAFVVGVIIVVIFFFFACLYNRHCPYDSHKRKGILRQGYIDACTFHTDERLLAFVCVERLANWCLFIGLYYDNKR